MQETSKCDICQQSVCANKQSYGQLNMVIVEAKMHEFHIRSFKLFLANFCQLIYENPSAKSLHKFLRYSPGEH